MRLAGWRGLWRSTPNCLGQNNACAMPPTPDSVPDLVVNCAEGDENANRQRRLIDASPLAGSSLAALGRRPHTLLFVSGIPLLFQAAVQRCESGARSSGANRFHQLGGNTHSSGPWMLLEAGDWAIGGQDG